MILTKSKIHEELLSGNITITPFVHTQINPNSYNYRIGDTIKVFTETKNDKPVFTEIKIPDDGYILYPDTLYLANTLEKIGSKKYAMSLIGKSSIGRLGLFLQVSANLGHTTSEHMWTLELVALKPIRIYKNIIIGQVSFWNNDGEISSYEGFFGRKNNIQESNI
jgi:dCTP deaminase